MSGARARRPASRRRSVAATLVLALGTLVVLFGAAWLVWTTPNGVPGASHYTLHARVGDLAGLGPHGDVRLAGRRVGQVLHTGVRGSAATLELQLDPSIKPLRADTRLTVRSQGLLGARFLQIVPGTQGAALADGAWIDASRVSASVTVPGLLDSLDAGTREHLGLTIRGLGAGVFQRGTDLNELFAQSPRLFGGLRSVSWAVLARPGAAQRLVPAVDSAVAAADAARRPLTGAFAPAARALRPFREQHAAVEQTLDIAPGTLDAARTGLAASGPLLVNARRLARAAAATLAPAPAALRDTTALLVTARRPLRRTGLLLQRLPAAVGPAVGLAHALTPELPRVERALVAPMPVLRELGPRACDVLGWASNWRSMLGFGVPGGGAIGPLNVLRFELIAGAQPTTLNLPDPLPEASDAYPAPCASVEQKLR